MRSHFDGIFNGLAVNWSQVALLVLFVCTRIAFSPAGCCTRCHARGMPGGYEPRRRLRSLGSVRGRSLALWQVSSSPRPYGDSISCPARDAVVIFITATLGSYFRMYNLAGWYGSLTGADQEKSYDELLKVFFLVLICIELTIFSICSGFCLDATKDKLKTKAMRAIWGRSKLRFRPPGCNFRVTQFEVL